MGRQFLSLFVLGSLLPLGLLSVLVLQAVVSQVEDQSEQRLHQAAKATGMALMGRLLELEDRLRAQAQHPEIVRAEEREEPFLAIARLTSRARPQLVRGDPQALEALHELDLSQLDPAQDVFLQTTAGGAVFLFVRDPAAGTWVAALRSDRLLAAARNTLPADAHYCIVLRPGTILGCSFEGQPAAVRAPVLFETASGPISWVHDEEPHRGQYWTLFLASRFGADPWLLVLGEPESVIHASVAEFEKLFGLTLGLAFLLVLLVSVNQIRRRLEPLRQLRAGTRAIAEGDFDARVDLESSNELEELAGSFNSMAHDLRGHFESQTRMIHFDRRLLAVEDEHGLIELLHEVLPELLPAERWLFGLWGNARVTGAQVFRARRGDSLDVPTLHSESDLKAWLGDLREPSHQAPGPPPPPGLELLASESEVLVLLPLKSKGDLSGFFAAVVPADAFDEAQVAVAGALVDRCSIALDHLRAIEANRQLSYYDRLTGLPNRRLFRERVRHATARAESAGRKLAVLIAGVDDFKVLNESLGHDRADRVLQVTAERLSAKLGEAGVARLGGDEFGILLDDAQSTVGVSARIEALKSCWSEPILIDGRQLRVGLSTGVSLYPEDGGTPEILFSASDAALHHAKEEEPGGVRFFTPAMNERAVGRLDLLAALEQALEREEFRVFYQPVVELELLEFASMEALVRWQRPDVGLVYPGAFIELAEETGLEVAIGSWVLTQAGRDIASWRSEGLAPPRVAINLSARQLRDPRLRSNVVKALMQARVPPSAISLELTERNLMDDSMVEVLDSLRSLGIRLAVDDFGTGYSSLGYLQRFPLDILKVDRSFVKDVATDAQAATITRACIAMAHELGLQVIAEGVETEEQLAFLRECKCDYAQGFLFSEAVPAEEIRKMLVRGEIG